jgi:hypothetical protein
MEHRFSWDSCTMIGAIPWIGRFRRGGRARREEQRVRPFEEAWAARAAGDEHEWITPRVRAEIVWRRWVFLQGREREDVRRTVIEAGPHEAVRARLGVARDSSSWRQVLDRVVSASFSLVLLGALYMTLVARSPRPVLVMFGVMWFFGWPAFVAAFRRHRARRRGVTALWTGCCPDCGYDTGSIARDGWSWLAGPPRCPECGGVWPMVPPPVALGRDFELVGESTGSPDAGAASGPEP